MELDSNALSTLLFLVCWIDLAASSENGICLSTVAYLQRSPEQAILVMVREGDKNPVYPAILKVLH